jgi:uncharacterized protein
MPLRGIAFLAIFLSIVFLLDWYVFQGVRTLTAAMQSPFWRKGVRLVYWIISAGLPLILIFAAFTMDRSKGFSPLFSYASSFLIALFFTKLAFMTVLLGGDALRVAEGGLNLIKGNADDIPFMPERRRFVSQLALGVAVIPFASFLYGIAKGKYNYKVHRHVLRFKDLPKAFDGFTITQLSDVHSGSFDDRDSVRRGLALAQEQGSDLLVFTGDMVNNTAGEFEPFVEMFSELKAPFGKYSVLGNHDYGDYIPWPSEEAKRENLSQLQQYQEAAGFRLLRDERIEIEKDGEKIALLGVENWGVGFGQRGDLSKAMQGLPRDTFKVLLSHDPTHWDHEVKTLDNPVHLTLSGHTHGMQMGVEIPGFRWSPVKYRYPKWAGIYEEAGRILHINRGFGFLGFSGRVGIWPEITVIELRVES